MVSLKTRNRIGGLQVPMNNEVELQADVVLRIEFADEISTQNFSSCGSNLNWKKDFMVQIRAQNWICGNWKVEFIWSRHFIGQLKFKHKGWYHSSYTYRAVQELKNSIFSFSPEWL